LAQVLAQDFGSQSLCVVHLNREFTSLYTMRTAIIVLACLACVGNGRKLQMPNEGTEEAQTDSSEALATLLRSFNTPAAGGLQVKGLRRSVPLQKLASVRMAETETKPETEAKPAAKKEEKAEPAEPEVLYSEALPFLTRRASLGPVGDYVGDVGFDPVGFTELFDIRWLREAEVKHCRVAMLAFVGFLFTDFYHLPGFDYTTVAAHDASVASGAMSQLLLWIGLVEVISAIATLQMLDGSGREPGDFGFDPIGFSNDPEVKKDLQMKELANGRLAMFAFGGAVTQAVLTGNSFPWLFGGAELFGGGGDFAWNIVP